MDRPDPIEPDTDDTMSNAVAKAIDRYREAHADVTVLQVLTGLETVRHALTEAWLRQQRNIDGTRD